jgi:FkbM family methyltransferase
MIKILKKHFNFLRLNLMSYIRKIKLYLFRDRIKTAHLNTGVNCTKRWYGTSYGGFFINPDLLNEKSVIYSFGIGKDISFDLKCIKKHRCSVYGFDPTPVSIQYVQSVKTPLQFQFQDYGISTTSGHQTFFLPANPRAVSGSMVANETVNKNKAIVVMMKSFEEIVSSLGHDHIDVLKMDIEGAEYDVLISVLDSPVSIDQILVEFHDRIFDTTILKSRETVELLKQKGYEVFGVSKSYEEVSFIRKDLLN